MSDIIDVRGLSCPEPVLRTKKALEKYSSFDVLADSETAKENIMRFCISNGAKAEGNIDNGEWRISIKK